MFWVTLLNIPSGSPVLSSLHWCVPDFLSCLLIQWSLYCIKWTSLKISHIIACRKESFWYCAVRKRKRACLLNKPLPTEWLGSFSCGLFWTNYDVTRVDRKTAEYWVINSSLQKTPRIWKKCTNGGYLLLTRLVYPNAKKFGQGGIPMFQALI